MQCLCPFRIGLGSPLLAGVVDALLLGDRYPGSLPLSDVRKLDLGQQSERSSFSVVFALRLFAGVKSRIYRSKAKKNV